MATETAPQSVSVGPRIEKTPGVCGGRAVIERTRIPVWLLVEFKRSGRTEADLLDDYPSLTADDLRAAWDYFHQHTDEIDHDIWENDIERDDFDQ